MNVNKYSLRWAAKVAQRDIERLYKSDAGGFIDMELANLVGSALYARCESILSVTALHDDGVLYCPNCLRLTGKRDDGFACECGYAITFRDAHLTYKGKQLYGANAVGIFRDFVKKFPQCKEYGQKMVCIDQLLHSFHSKIDLRGDGESDIDYGRPVSANLIEGKLAEVISFLRRLSSSPSHDEWVCKMERIPWVRDNNFM